MLIAQLSDPHVVVRSTRCGRRVTPEGVDDRAFSAVQRQSSPSFGARFTRADYPGFASTNLRYCAMWRMASLGLLNCSHNSARL